MTSEAINTQVREYLAGHLANAGLSDSDDIFVTGGASSLFAMELVMYIESAFGIELDDADLERENLATIGAITALVTAKKGLVAESGDV